MSSKYKVHRNYDVDWITKENPCRCSNPLSGITIFNQETTPDVHQTDILKSYNETMNGTIFTANDIKWENLRKSECVA